MNSNPSKLDVFYNSNKSISPGLVVMGDSSCSKGCGFELRCCIMDGIFFTLICWKNCIVCLKRLKKQKRDRGWHYLKKQVKKFGLELESAKIVKSIQLVVDFGN